MKEEFDRASFESMEEKHKKEVESFIDSAHQEALSMNERVDLADKFGLSGEAKKAFVEDKIHYNPEQNYVRPMAGVAENQIIELIKQIPSLDMYCACGSGLMTQKLLEAIIEKNPAVDLTDIYVIENGNRWLKEAKKLSGGQCKGCFSTEESRL